MRIKLSELLGPVGGLSALPAKNFGLCGVVGLGGVGGMGGSTGGGLLATQTTVAGRVGKRRGRDPGWRRGAEYRAQDRSAGNARPTVENEWYGGGVVGIVLGFYFGQGGKCFIGGGFYFFWLDVFWTK